MLDIPFFDTLLVVLKELANFLKMDRIPLYLKAYSKSANLAETLGAYVLKEKREHSPQFLLPKSEVQEEFIKALEEQKKSKVKKVPQKLKSFDDTDLQKVVRLKERQSKKKSISMMDLRELKKEQTEPKLQRSASLFTLGGKKNVLKRIKSSFVKSLGKVFHKPQSREVVEQPVQQPEETKPAEKPKEGAEMVVRPKEKKEDKKSKRRHFKKE
ncbi:hypothetical protein EIN_273730 [Entamoeba invadens IP1]|uniref:Uncharacterized protein n=1 Tax=Entamoeba invadens IP1 TaxID=370355 RepID=A0A0A1U783_ENTIV|nr:hypothetical protein EIN_273730 [Entamoeba invadens IP1]ELP87836.1 hypothetical protein EIN_273730 [Entamoeba invadens IP1]|eukprot:XP_004254607.1 hypothetical protein EIN_273730 [Entamoeba invadens IP1]